MSNGLEASVVSVLHTDGHVVGTGFVTSPRLILTCAHVVRQAGGEPDSRVTICFHVGYERRLALVLADYWRPPDGGEDVAVLQVEGELLVGIVPLVLGKTLGADGHPFRAFGYAPFGKLTGLWATGKIQGSVVESTGQQLLQLESPDLAPGMSGAPVLDEATGKVVGMVTAGSRPDQLTHKHRDLALATPTETLLRVCPILTLKAQSQPSASPNPFFTGGAVPPDLFVGRASVLALIKTRLGGRSLQSVSIVGERRIGKSSLLRYVHERAASLFDPRPVVVYLDLMKAYCHTRAGFSKALRRELTAALGREPWPAPDDADPATLSFALEDLSRAGTRLLLCLDEVEELTKRRAEFDGLLEELRAAGQLSQIGMLTASAHSLASLCQSGGLTSPFHNIFLQETLGLLADAEWRALVRDRMSVTDAEMQAIERLAGGHPFYTQVAASRLWEAKQGGEQDWIPLAFADMKPHWASQWQHLLLAEQTVLRDAAGSAGLVPDARLIEPLRRRGLLHPDRYRPFSDAYADWIASPFPPSPDDAFAFRRQERGQGGEA